MKITELSRRSNESNLIVSMLEVRSQPRHYSNNTLTPSRSILAVEESTAHLSLIGQLWTHLWAMPRLHTLIQASVLSNPLTYICQGLVSPSRNPQRCAAAPAQFSKLAQPALLLVGG